MLQYRTQSELALGCAFRDIETQDSNRLPARLWRGTRKAVASFLYLAEETEDAAKGHRQMVQPDQGLWVHQAERQRQGRVRPHLRRRTCRTLNPQRKPGG